MKKLTHFNKKGQSRMVDVTQKEETIRIAIATGKVLAKLETLQLIADRKFSKGDVLEIARIAGIMATKRTADLIPLCHPIPVLESRSICQLTTQIKVLILRPRCKLLAEQVLKWRH